MGWPSARNITDDRGTRRRAYAGSSGATSTEMPEAEYRELCRRLRGMGWAGSVFMWVGATYFAIAFLRRLSTGVFGWQLLPAAGFIALWVFFARRSQTAFPDRPGWQIAQELRAINRCPSCAYLLECVPAADDGCRVCPECGAAWKLKPPEQPVTLSTGGGGR